jgi:TIR domain
MEHVYRESPQIIYVAIITALALMFVGLHKLRAWRERRKTAIREKILRGEFLTSQKIAQNKHAIFISYRRDDCRDITERVYDKLRGVFGEDTVFKDANAISVAEDFQGVILKALVGCKVFILMMGKNWQGKVTGTERSRIDDPADLMAH